MCESGAKTEPAFSNAGNYGAKTLHILVKSAFA